MTTFDLAVTQKATLTFVSVYSINYYSPRIFQSLGVRGTNTSLFATGVYGVVKTVTAIVSLLLLMDRIGRRASLLGGAVIMIIAQFYVGTYIKIAKPDPAGTSSIDGAGISALAFVYIYGEPSLAHVIILKLADV